MRKNTSFILLLTEKETDFKVNFFLIYKLEIHL